MSARIELSFYKPVSNNVIISHTDRELVSIVLHDVIQTRSYDAIRIQGSVTPYGLFGNGINHRPHHLVKCLIGISFEHTLLVSVDKAPSKPENYDMVD